MEIALQWSMGYWLVEYSLFKTAFQNDYLEIVTSPCLISDLKLLPWGTSQSALTLNENLAWLSLLGAWNMNNFQIEILRNEKWWSKVFVGFVSLLLLFHGLYVSLKAIFRHTGNLQCKPLAFFQKLRFLHFNNPWRKNRMISQTGKRWSLKIEVNLTVKVVLFTSNKCISHYWKAVTEKHFWYISFGIKNGRNAAG